MHNLKISIATALLAGMLLNAFPGIAYSDNDISSEATQKQPLEVILTVNKIVMLNGVEKTMKADRAEPGDTLEYRARYTNTGAVALAGLIATLPLPEHTTFLHNSSLPAGAEGSERGDKNRFVKIDAGAKSHGFGEAAKKNGDTFGALRWKIDMLKPAQVVTVRARVTVDAAAAPASSVLPALQTVETLKGVSP